MGKKQFAAYKGYKIILTSSHNGGDPREIPITITKSASIDIVWPGETPIIGSSKYSDLNYNYQFYHPKTLIWLKDIIENNTDKKIFVFGHHFLPNKPGNSTGIPTKNNCWVYGESHPDDDMVAVTGVNDDTKCCHGSTQLSGMEFYFINKLNNEHKNVVFFSGHSHFTWANMNDNDTAGTNDISSNKFKCSHIDNHDYNIIKPSDYESLSDNVNKYIYSKASNTPKSESGYWIALPSLSKPVNPSSSQKDKNTLRPNADITIMDIYQNGIKIKGYSLIRAATGEDNKFQASYSNYDLNNPLIEKDIVLTGSALGSYSYSVGLLSDLHLHEENDYSTSEDDLWYDADDLKKALDIFNIEYKNSSNGHEISFICACGDITESFCTNTGYGDSTRFVKEPWPEHDADEFYNVYNAYHGNLKFYTPLGNHDFMGLFNKRTGESSSSAYNTGVNNRINNIWINKIQCFAGSGLSYCNYSNSVSNRNKLSYYFEHNGDIYVMLSVDYGDDIWAAPSEGAWSGRMINARHIIDTENADESVQAIKSYISDTEYSESASVVPVSSDLTIVNGAIYHVYITAEMADEAYRNVDDNFNYNASKALTTYTSEGGYAVYVPMRLSDWSNINGSTSNADIKLNKVYNEVVKLNPPQNADENDLEYLGAANDNNGEYITFKIHNDCGKRIVWNGQFAFFYNNSNNEEVQVYAGIRRPNYTNPYEHIYYLNPTNFIFEKNEVVDVKVPLHRKDGIDMRGGLKLATTNHYRLYYSRTKDEDNLPHSKSMTCIDKNSIKSSNKTSTNNTPSSPSNKYTEHSVLGPVYIDLNIHNTGNTDIYIFGQFKFYPMAVKSDGIAYYGGFYLIDKNCPGEYSYLKIPANQTVTLSHDNLVYEKDSSVKDTSTNGGGSWISTNKTPDFLNGATLYNATNRTLSIDPYIILNENGTIAWNKNKVLISVDNPQNLTWNAGTANDIQVYNLNLTENSSNTTPYWTTPR